MSQDASKMTASVAQALPTSSGRPSAVTDLSSETPTAGAPALETASLTCPQVSALADQLTHDHHRARLSLVHPRTDWVKRGVDAGETRLVIRPRDRLAIAEASAKNRRQPTLALPVEASNRAGVNRQSAKPNGANCLRRYRRENA